MKILYVATDYPERGKPTTGFPNYLYRVSLALVQMGHEPVILAAGARDSHRVEHGIDIWTVGVEHVSYKSKTLNYLVNAINKGYILNQKVKQLIKSLSIEIVQFTSLEGIAIFYNGNIPAVLRLSSYAKIAYSSFQTCSWINVKIMSFMERISAHKCNIIFAPCKNTAVAFGKDCKRRVKVIETPFLSDVEKYDEEYIEKYLKDRKYALFFGTMYAEKGILVIADILKKFLQENSQYYFVFVGKISNEEGNNYVQLLKREAGDYKDRVIIWNELPHSQLYPIVMGADFVVLPSLMENLSNACIEAMYFERVVIGTDGASFEQLIIHEKNGLLCKIGDSQDLLEKMQMAVSMSPEQRVQMGQQAGLRIKQLKPQVVVKQLLELYEYLIENSRSRKIRRNK